MAREYRYSFFSLSLSGGFANNLDRADTKPDAQATEGRYANGAFFVGAARRRLRVRLIVFWISWSFCAKLFQGEGGVRVRAGSVGRKIEDREACKLRRGDKGAWWGPPHHPA